METLEVPCPTFTWDAACLDTEWKRFQQHVELMFQGPLHALNEEKRCAFLLIWLGDTGREIYNSWKLSVEDAEKLNVLLDKFNEHCEQRAASSSANPVLSRYIFHQRRQEPEESLESFVTDLRNLVNACAYKEPQEMVRDRIVAGILSDEMREKLLNEGATLTLDHAIELCAAFEGSHKHQETLAESSSNKTVDMKKSRRAKCKKQSRKLELDQDMEVCATFEGSRKRRKPTTASSSNKAIEKQPRAKRQKQPSKKTNQGTQREIIDSSSMDHHVLNTEDQETPCSTVGEDYSWSPRPGNDPDPPASLPKNSIFNDTDSEEKSSAVIYSEEKSSAVITSSEDPHTATETFLLYRKPNSKRRSGDKTSSNGSFMCDVCAKILTRHSSLKKHKLIHLGQKNHVCDVCDKAFSEACSLKIHKLIHLGQKDYVCEICSKAFSTYTNFRTHMFIHEGVKPYVCDICSKAFHQGSNLNTHKLFMHSGKKDFPCDSCDKAFVRLVDLRRHEVSHTGKKNYVCDVCNKAYNYYNGLAKHKRTQKH